MPVDAYVDTSVCVCVSSKEVNHRRRRQGQQTDTTPHPTQPQQLSAFPRTANTRHDAGADRVDRVGVGAARHRRQPREVPDRGAVPVLFGVCVCM